MLQRKAECQPLLRAIARLIGITLLPKCSRKHRSRRNSLVEKQPTEPRGSGSAARVIENVLRVRPNFGVVPGEGCRNCGKAPMRHHHLWIADHRRKRSELARS